VDHLSMRSIKTLSLVQFNDKNREIAVLFAIFHGIQADSQKVKTVWRRRQSDETLLSGQIPC